MSEKNTELTKVAPQALFSSEEELSQLLRKSGKRIVATSMAVRLPDKKALENAMRIAEKQEVYLVRKNTGAKEYAFASSFSDPLANLGRLLEAIHEVNKNKKVKTVRVARSVKAAGYTVAFIGGYRVENIRDLDGDDVFAVLREKPKIDGNLQRADLVCEIWFDSKPRDASPKKWVMEIYGAENAKEMMKLKEILQEKYKVDIETDLITKPCEEAFTSDVVPAFAYKYGATP